MLIIVTWHEHVEQKISTFIKRYARSGGAISNRPGSARPSIARVISIKSNRLRSLTL